MVQEEVSLREIKARRKAALEWTRTLIISNRAGYGLVVRAADIAAEKPYLEELARLERQKHRRRK